MNPLLLTLGEAAQIMGRVSEKTIEKKIKEGAFEYIEDLARGKLVVAESLERWVQENKKRETEVCQASTSKQSQNSGGLDTPTKQVSKLDEVLARRTRKKREHT